MNPSPTAAPDEPPANGSTAKPPLAPELVAAAQVQAEAALSEATIQQLSFKPGVCRDCAVAILVTMLEDRIRWADEFDFSFVGAADRNVIGTTWKRLATLGIVERMDQHRRSTAGSAKGRTVWKYHLRSPRLAKTFLARNGRYVPAARQPELFSGVNR